MATETESLLTEPVQAPAQIKVQFSTQHADISLPDSTGPIIVPTNLRRYGLSTLVNHLLNTANPTPFDFLHSGTFLRTSIDEYLTEHGLSAETTLSLEYVRSIIPPPYVTSFLHDDWVSAVDVLSPTSPAARWAAKGRVEGVGVSDGVERILSGSYDGILRVWDTKGLCLGSSPAVVEEGGHASSVKAAKFLSPTRIVSSGLDRTVRVWKYTETPALNHYNDDDSSPAAQITPSLDLYGHHGSVDAVVVHAPTHHILSASTDHTISLFSTQKSSAPEAPPSLISSSLSGTRSKRRKTTAPAVQPPKRGPLSTLKAHTAPVSDVIFAPHDPTVGYSTSWDHTLRTFDLTTSALVDTRTTSHALLSLTALPSLNLLAAGTSARHITLIDPRASAREVGGLVLRGHTNAAVSLMADPKNDWGLASGGHDGTVRVWDVRTASSSSVTSGAEGANKSGGPVWTIEREGSEAGAKTKRIVGGEGVKVFGVCWDEGVGIVSAGEDRRVQINRGEGTM
ncbi:MAG: ribosome biogenesis protein ytm1 [Caeruleum heppii]|nr:MAG: ribosome biogenesis protein ytm1 [Caeruleum heppii]